MNGSTVGSSLLVKGMLLLVPAGGKVRDWLDGEFLVIELVGLSRSEVRRA